MNPNKSSLFEEKKDFGVFFLFLVFIVVLTIWHEPWRDEAQAWLIAQSSHSLLTMIHQMGYEGTPCLWHFLLYILTHLGFPYLSLQLLNLVLMVAAVILIIKHAPFGNLNKYLLIFGYFFAYEYGTIARSYTLLVLLLFLIAHFYRSRFEKPIIFSIISLLLFNTSVHGLIIGLILAALITWEAIAIQKMTLNKLFMPALILVSGMAFAIVQLRSPSDLATFLKIWHTSYSLDDILHYVAFISASAFFPVPPLQTQFWNHLLLPGNIIYPVGLILYLGSLMALIRKPRVFLFYMLSSISLFALFIAKYCAAIRHTGLIFILFIFSLWIAREYETAPVGNLSGLFIKCRKISPLLLSALLAIQVSASLISANYEIRYDFSASKRTMAYLTESGLVGPNTTIAALSSPQVSSIIPYLVNTDTKFYRIEVPHNGTFVTWNKDYERKLLLSTDDRISLIIQNICDRNVTYQLLLISYYPLGKTGLPYRGFILQKAFTNTIVADESYFIYKYCP